MARTKILSRRNINSLTRKIPYKKIPIGIRVVKMPKKPLSIAYSQRRNIVYPPPLSKRYTLYSPTNMALYFINRGLFYRSILGLQNKPLFV